MKPLALVVMGLSMVLGAGSVYLLYAYGPRVPKKPKASPAAVRAEVEEAPSKRVVVYPNSANPASTLETREVLQAAPTGVDARWAALNKQAIQALDAGLDAKAVELFEQCHTGVPTEAVFTANLAEALARLGSSEFDRGGAEDEKHAILHMTRAAELAPDRADIQRRLAQMKALAKSEEGMWTDESEHFVLTYDGSRGELLWGSREITMPLERAYQEFGELFGFFPVEDGRAKIRVILYKKDGFHDATGIGHWAGGLFDGAVRVPVENLGREKETLVRVLRHESAHAFVHELGGRDVPGWLNEGLAQRLECDSMQLAAATLDAARRKLHGAKLIGLKDLSGSLGDQKDAERIAFAYAQSLAFVGWIERTYGDRVPYEMVAGCKSAQGFDAAFEARTGVKLADAFADFEQGL